MKGESKNIWDTTPTNSVTLIFLSFIFLIYKVKKYNSMTFPTLMLFYCEGWEEYITCDVLCLPHIQNAVLVRAIVSVVFAPCTTMAEMPGQSARNGRNMLRNVFVFLSCFYQHNFSHLPLLIKITTSFENMPTNSIIKCLLEFCINLILTLH